jgi:uncharacterized protein YhaN
MADRSNPDGTAESAKRGEAAWKAAKEQVTARNDQVRKLGRQRRQVEETRIAELRRDAESRERAQLPEQPRPPLANHPSER